MVMLFQRWNNVRIAMLKFGWNPDFVLMLKKMVSTLQPHFNRISTQFQPTLLAGLLSLQSVGRGFQSLGRSWFSTLCNDVLVLYRECVVLLVVVQGWWDRNLTMDNLHRLTNFAFLVLSASTVAPKVVGASNLPHWIADSNTKILSLYPFHEYVPAGLSHRSNVDPISGMHTPVLIGRDWCMQCLSVLPDRSPGSGQGSPWFCWS